MIWRDIADSGERLRRSALSPRADDQVNRVHHHPGWDPLAAVKEMRSREKAPSIWITSARHPLSARSASAEINNRLRKGRRRFLGRVVADVIQHSRLILSGEELRVTFG